jgi:3-dehydroquinate dehydratase / shikimate dehydrogenase
MTRLCVPIFVNDLSQAQRDIAAAAEAGADLVELRVDTFTDLEQVRQLVQQSTLPAIVTCRAANEGGHCELSDQERLPVLETAAIAGASYIDIELASYSRSANLRQKVHFNAGAPIDATVPREKRAGLIVSSHDFRGRPDRLNNIVTEMNATGGDINKLIWMPRSIRDNQEVFELLNSRQKPTIALCMGEAGLISRVLAKKFGAFLTFAALKADYGTAPGQVTIGEMKNLYRWDAIGAETKVFGVIGSPIMHSMSPAIHNAAFSEIGFDGVYLPLLVNEGYESFKAFMETFVRAGPLRLSGLSVTIPHKENALRYLKETGGDVEPLAARIGAVNTITDGTSQLRGMNTDYAAILDTITGALSMTREGLSDLRIAVIGAGGTGRTAVAALAYYGATVVVYNRTRERADVLAKEFDGNSGKVVSARMEKLCDSCCHVFINTTPIGMYPKIDASPIGDRMPKFTDETLVFDTVYNPIETKFLRQAREAGAKTVGGIEMFVRQASAQFEQWTGLAAPVQRMRSVVLESLSRPA